MRFQKLIQSSGAVLLCALSLAAAQAATGGEPAAVIQLDVASCLAATAADDMDKAATACAAVIDNDKTAKADLIKALIARAALYARHDQIDRAIADDSRALLLDPTLADIFNARGELWLKKGDKPKAVQDFGAALKIDPNHEKAKANHKAMAREIERIGAQMAVAGKPSFNCRRAARAVEKAICGNRELADLDREIYGSHLRAIREAQSPAEARKIQRAQDDFIARRNAGYGRPGYDLKKAMQDRLQEISGVDGY
ncbi:tetratricopeptide repeat protein [Bradyrhizobium sp. 141]|uniref:tetratricopeptide repeat protein n=1 Tax=Bradyrhizobium sp. 141 TaxID=2782617 RepID=UPI001FF9555A|nr:tetratricopeptide repeat protein [Bradyrhizobium sp. 141]MCK1717213.1 tetratricopeptide repeat protein [Bradyrhizobium sp. 141]